MFSKFDLAIAYQQKSFDEAVTIDTHRELHCYTRLSFGIASAPAISQKAMDTILQRLQDILCYLDDISNWDHRIGAFAKPTHRVLRSKHV